MFDQERFVHARKLMASRTRDVHSLLDTYARRATRTGPCDREKAERAVSAVYRAAELQPPRFIWHDSPIDAAKTFSVITYARSLRSIAGELLVAAHGIDTDEIVSEIRAQQGRLALGFTDHIARICRALSSEAQDEIRRTLRYEWFYTPPAAREFDEAVARIKDLKNISEYYRIDTLTSGVASAFSSSLNGTSARFGPADAWSIGIIDTCRLLGFNPGPAFEPLVETMHECGWWWPLIGTCIMCERPSELHFEGYELHRLNAPAVLWPSGASLYFIKDLHVPCHVAHGEFTARDVENERNVEVRMAMLHVFGMERYLNESNAQCIQADDFGSLYRIHLGEDAEDLCLVRVKNSTPEPDGTYKDYILRVPPRMQTAREAVAWTFAMEEQEYDPQKET